MITLPSSELEIMMAIWEYKRPVTRIEIEKKLNEIGRNLHKTSILTYLVRLQAKGFINTWREGKNNIFEAIITEEEYMKEESPKILNNMYHSSVKNFVCSLYDGDALSDDELKELRDFIDSKIDK